MKFLMIVDDPKMARFVSENGVDRLFVDLENIGKQDRQGHLSTWISKQSIEDVSKIRTAAPDAHLLVRINPLNNGSKSEIEEVISRGANSIMLPMFHTIDEVSRFLDLLAGRVDAVPLVETVSALAIVPQMIDSLEISELHIGLNDLHLDMGLNFMFEPISNGALESPCAALRAANIPFGIGGIARVGEGIVSPEYLVGEHVRLGSSRAILSRTFHRNATTVEEIQNVMDFGLEIAKIRDLYDQFFRAGPEVLEQNRVLTADRIRDVVQLIVAKRGTRARSP